MRRISVFLLLPLVSFADQWLVYMQKYVGRWVGDFTIHSAATGYSENFPVEQRYWIQEDKLHGISVSETDRGMQTATSITYTKEGKLCSEVTRDKETEAYWGLPHDDGIVWLSVDLARASDYQQREFFTEEAGELWLETEGFDTFIFQEGLARIIYRGRMKKVADAASADRARAKEDTVAE